MNGMLETIAKSSSYHCIVLTLSAVDRQMSPMMILWPSTRREGRPRRVGSWFMMCDFFVKNDERAVARLKYLIHT